MRTRRSILLLALLPLIAAVLLMGLGRREPEYQGRALSAWLADLTSPRRSESERAIRGMASHAVPFLISELLVTDSRIKLNLVRLGAEQRLVPITFTHAKERHERARAALKILGPLAKPAIPALIEAFKHGNEGYSLCGPYDAFTAIGIESVPPLIAACTNDNKWIRFFAVRALQNFPGKASTVVPQLIGSLHDPDPTVRYGAVGSLMFVKDLPNLAIPALAQALSDQDPDVREVAAETFGIYGPVAKFALPSLRKALDDPDPSVRGAAAWSVVKIDPAAAKELKPVRKILVENLSNTDHPWLPKKSREALKQIDAPTNN